MGAIQNPYKECASQHLGFYMTTVSFASLTGSEQQSMA